GPWAPGGSAGSGRTGARGANSRPRGGGGWGGGGGRPPRPTRDPPPRHEYVLTDKGRDFFPVVAAIMRWGDRWLDDGEGPPLVLHHTGCDHDMHAEVVCSSCGEPLALREVRARVRP